MELIYCLISTIIIIIYIKWQIRKLLEIIKSERIDPKVVKEKFKDVQQFIPNGWLPVLESEQIKTNQVKLIHGLGRELVIFRGQSGKVYVLDPYCPHLGANLGFGQVVSGDSIECPFHGWIFNQEGQCTYMPGLEDSKPLKTKIKVWNSLEANEMIFVWHHSQGKQPTWFIDQLIDETLFNKANYQTKTQCFILDILQNSADLHHLVPVHQHFLPKNFVLAKYLSKLPTIFKLDFNLVDFMESSAPNQHILDSTIKITGFLLGYKAISASIKFKSLGPAFAIFRTNLNLFNSIDIYIVITLSIISTDDYNHLVIDRFYSNNTLFNRVTEIFSLPWLHLQATRDCTVWNTKKSLKTPVLPKSESFIKRYNRWYQQFFTDNTD